MASTWLTCPARLNTTSAPATAGATTSAAPMSASITVIGPASPLRLQRLAPWVGTAASITVTSAPTSARARLRPDPMKPSPPVTTQAIPANCRRSTAPSTGARPTGRGGKRGDACASLMDRAELVK